MPELLLELFSEEIPARMQARAAEELARLVTAALAALNPAGVHSFYGPRRIALAMALEAAVPATSTIERGPRAAAPEQALTGFLRKHGASRDALVREGEHWVLHKQAPAQLAAGLVAASLPGLLRKFSLAEIDALGRLGQPVHLGASVAPYPMRARWRHSNPSPWPMTQMTGMGCNLATRRRAIASWPPPPSRFARLRNGRLDYSPAG